MIAVDTSCWISYFSGAWNGKSETEKFELALKGGGVCVPWAVYVEVLSDFRSFERLLPVFQDLPKLEIRDGYWDRVAALRRNILKHGFKAFLGDALIAQTCIDHDVPLLTEDKDFRHFAKYGNLKLI